MESNWSRIRPLVLFGWMVALIRFGMEPTLHPSKGQPAWYFGVYFLMPVAFIVVGVRGGLRDVRWPKIALLASFVGLLVWGIPDIIVYTTAQFLGWTHGRFEPNVQAAPVAETGLGKLGRGLGIGALTGIAGAIWSLVWMTLVVWLPGHLRRRREAA